MSQGLIKSTKEQVPNQNAAASSSPRWASTSPIIAHPGNPAASVSREFLADAFLKRTTRWPNGEAIRAVDQRLDARCARNFPKLCCGSMLAVRCYWEQLIFSGRGVPPPELESDEAVVRHVQSHRGAIGYVSERDETGSVKVITLR